MGQHFIHFRCEDSTNNDIDKKDGIDTSSFYVQLGTAQVKENPF